MSVILTRTTAPPTQHRSQGSFFGRWGALTVLLVFLCLPLVVLALFSFSSTWVNTILPGGYTLSHWLHAFTTQAALAAVWRSVFLAFLVTAINIVVVLPAAYVAVVAKPQVRPLIQSIAIVPFALPWIVIAAGMQLTVRDIAPELFGTVGLLVFVLAGVTFPYMYYAVENALMTNNAVQLAEAAKMSGAGVLRTLVTVMMPTARTGMMVGSLLVASSTFGEFAISQTLVGTSFETLPLWSLRMFGGRIPGGESSLAVISIATFLLLFAVSLLISHLERAQADTASTKRQRKAKVARALTRVHTKG